MSIEIDDVVAAYYTPEIADYVSEYDNESAGSVAVEESNTLSSNQGPHESALRQE